MPTSTVIIYAENGAQFWYDAVHGTIFDSGLYIAIVVLIILLGVLMIATGFLRRIFPRRKRF